MPEQEELTGGLKGKKGSGFDSQVITENSCGNLIRYKGREIQKTGPLLQYGENKPLSLTCTCMEQLPEEYFQPCQEAQVIYYKGEDVYAERTE